MSVRAGGFAALASVVCLLSYGLASPAAARAELPREQHFTLPEAARSTIVATMTEAGIESHVQGRLLDKIESGRLPDSMTGVAPVRTTESSSADGSRMVMEFGDGSRRWVDIETPTAGVRTGVSGCSTSGVWKVNCKVEIRDLMSSARFTIDYYPSPSTRSKVREFRASTCAVALGDCKLRSPKGIARAAQSSAGAAWARLSYSLSMGPLHAEGEFGIRVGSRKSVKAYQ